MGELIPAIAFRYKPTEDYIYTGEKSEIKRSIYYKTQLTPYEKSSIEEFKNYVKDKLPCKSIPDYFCDEEILRILIKHRFENKRAVDGLIGEIEWRTSMLPNSYSSLGLRVQNIVNSGIVYIAGRDNRFRPLLIIDSEKIAQIKGQIEKICYLLIFFIEFIRTKLSIPGKVENFILLLDLAGRTTSSAPVKELKKLFEIIQLHYPSYLSLNYIINSGGKGIFGNAFNNFMDSETTRRTLYDSSNGSDYLSIHFNPGQFEKKYGGALENFSEFWPVIMPPGPFYASGECEDDYLGAVDVSVGGFESLAEKIFIDLPFEGEENGLGESLSVRLEKSYGVVDEEGSKSGEEGSVEKKVVRRLEEEMEDDSSEEERKICCKRGKCLIL